MGEINMNIDVIDACFYLLENSKMDIVGGGFEGTEL